MTLEKRMDDLEEKLEVVIENLQKVGSMSKDDAETAMIYIRKSTEAIASVIFEETSGSSADKKTLQDYVNYFSKKNVVPEEITNSIRAIQTFCNPAAHSTGKNRKMQYQKSIQPSLMSLTLIVEWYFLDHLKRPMPVSLDGDKQSANYQENDIYDNMMKTKTLRVGCIPFPPFMNYKKTKDGLEFSGYYYDLLKAFEQEHDIKIEFIPLRNEVVGLKLIKRDVDIVANWVVNEERLNHYDFFAKLFQVSIGGMKRKDGIKIRSIKDLRSADINILTCKGEIGDYIVHNKLNINDETTNIERQETSDLSRLFKMVEAELSDIAITDNITCQHYLKANPDSPLENIFLNMPLYSDEVGMLTLKKQDKVINFIEAFIENYRQKNDIEEREEALLDDYHGAIMLNQ